MQRLAFCAFLQLALVSRRQRCPPKFNIDLRWTTARADFRHADRPIIIRSLRELTRERAAEALFPESAEGKRLCGLFDCATLNTRIYHRRGLPRTRKERARGMEVCEDPKRGRGRSQMAKPEWRSVGMNVMKTGTPEKFRDDKHMCRSELRTCLVPGIRAHIK